MKNIDFLAELNSIVFKKMASLKKCCKKKMEVICGLRHKAFCDSRVTPIADFPAAHF
jgi:hypothetical protein